MVLPYIGVLLITTVLTIPYFKISGVQGEIRRKRGGLRSENALLFLAYAIYILFAAFKDYKTTGFASNDAYAYYANFLQANASLRNFFVISSFEPGYTLITWIMRRFTENYAWTLFFWHTLTFCLNVYFYKHIYLKKNSVLAILAGFMILFTQFNTHRMAISISIAVCSFVAMDQKHWIKALFIILIAMSMQISAIIMIPVLFVAFTVNSLHRYRKTVIYALTVLGVVMCAALLGLAERILTATTKEIYLGQSAIAWGTYGAVILFFIFAIIRYRQLIQINSINRILIPALPICLVCIPLQFRIAVMYRLTLYFLPVMLALIPSLLACYKHEKQTLLKAAVYASCYIYLIMRIYDFCMDEVPLLGQYVNTLLQ